MLDQILITMTDFNSTPRDVNGTANGADCETSSYSESELWAKLKRYAKKAGAKLVLHVLKLRYAFWSPNTPAWAKAIIVSALVYFICPVDAIPDTIPVIGFSDDLTAVAAAVNAVRDNLTPEVVAKAKAKHREWFDEVDDAELA